MGAKINNIEEISRMGFYERFASKIFPEPNSGCWIWVGRSNQYGYGLIKIFYRAHLAHRVSYECKYGHPVPSGLHIDHLCRVTYCVNPDHLEVVTQSENNRRQHFASRKPEFQSLEVCFNGHLWTPETTTFTKLGARLCLTCKRDYDREYKRQLRLIAREVA